MKYSLITALIMTMVGCGEAEQTETKPAAVQVNGDVVATVNGSPIGSEDFAMLAARKSPGKGSELSLEERKEVLDDLVTEELLYQKALAEGYDKDPKVKKVMVNALIRKEIYDSIKNSDFSDAELEAYYNEHISEFTVPAKVQIYSILVKVTEDRPDAEAQAKAERLYSQIRRDPSKFRDIAKEESESPYKRRGGDVGFVPQTGKPGLDQEIVDKAFGMNVETLSKPFKTNSGWNVIYVPAKREAKDRSFTQMKGSVLRKIKNERVKEMYETYTSGLRQGVNVSIDDAKLQGVEIKSSGPSKLTMPNGLEMGQ